MKENYDKDLIQITKKVVTFLEPIETKFTGIGLPALFCFLANITGSGVIATAPMGAGKTLMSRILEYLMDVGGFSDKTIVFQEFKKQDWIRIFTERYYDKKFFYFSVPEISALSEYSQELFLQKIPALQSDGDFEYSFGTEPDQLIKITNSNCSYFIASQPPKTYGLINNTTFKTLANDRCWNILIINQIRGKENIPISDVKKIIYSIKWNKVVKDVKVKNYFRIPYKDIKFKNSENKTVKHISESSLDLTELEDIIRNQYSVDRRDEIMNTILQAFASFCNDKFVKQVHVDLFCTLFGFYIQLFNKLTIGSIEQSIDIKYGAMEMLCRISALISRNRVITQELLQKEFNTSELDVNLHLNELVESLVLTERKIKVKPEQKRVKSSKTKRTVQMRTKELILNDLIQIRRANNQDIIKDNDVKHKQLIYEFTDKINGFFKIYSKLLENTLPKNKLKILQKKGLEKFLDV